MRALEGGEFETTAKVPIQAFIICNFDWSLQLQFNLLVAGCLPRYLPRYLGSI